MFEVFITYEALERVFLQKESELYKIIINIKNPNNGIHVSGLPNNWYEYDFDNEINNSALYWLAQENTIQFDDCTKYIGEVLKDNSKVLYHPCALFILDIPEDCAKKITQDYGVICLSAKTEKYDLSYLTGESTHKNVILGKKNENWGSTLMVLKNTPSNSLIIADRYIFDTNDYPGEGLNNCKSILNALLPISFKGDYYVLILAERKWTKDRILNKYKPINQKYDGLFLKELCEKIKEMASNLRNYRIFFEIAICANIKEFAHNRRIISNYYFIKAEHGFCAFKKDKDQKDEIIFNNPIDIFRLFSCGLPAKLKSYSDIPNEQQSYLLKEYKQYFYDQKRFFKEHKENGRNDPEWVESVDFRANRFIQGNNIVSKLNDLEIKNRLLL